MEARDVNISSPDSPGCLHVARCACTGAVVGAALFLLCWLAAALSFGGGHMDGAYMGAMGWGGQHMQGAAFTMVPFATMGGLGVGLVCSLAMGFLIGGLIAVVYNAFAFVSRR